MSERLVELISAAKAAAEGDLAARVAWLEQVAAAATDDPDLGDRGALAARDLRAALGAVVAYAQGSQDPDELPALEAAMRFFAARGLHTLYGALAATYEELARASPPKETQVQALARAFRLLEGAVAAGKPPPDEAVAILRRLRK